MTQEMKFTPGPWEAGDNFAAEAGEFLVWGSPDADGTPCLVAVTYSEPNARLIAAAPKLLEALIKVERWSFDTATEIPPDVYATLRAAIAKAEPSDISACSSPVVNQQMMGRAKRVKTDAAILDMGFDKPQDGAK